MNITQFTTLMTVLNVINYSPCLIESKRIRVNRNKIRNLHRHAYNAQLWKEILTYKSDIPKMPENKSIACGNTSNTHIRPKHMPLVH